MKKFDSRNYQLINQFKEREWIVESGVSEEALKKEFDELMANKFGLSKALIKAKTYELLAEHSRIAVDKEDIFQDKLFNGNLLNTQKRSWEKEVTDKFMSKQTEQRDGAWHRYGTYNANGDYGHTSPNSKLLLEVGVTGLLERVEKASLREGITEKQNDFYNSCKITLGAFLRYMSRLADGIEPYNKENADALRSLTVGAPKNSYEAMQLLIAYFFFHEYVGKTRVRTLGRLDVLLYPFYKNDIEKGIYTKDEIKEMLKFFLNKFWTAKVPFDLPLCLGGDETSEISYLIVETYNELNIHSPKIHIRVSDKTPISFIKLVLECIRGGNSSFVFVNDNVV